jgi:hypothetical protein
MYGTLYGMVKTTVYLPEELKKALERIAQAEGRSEADLIREGIRLIIDRGTPEPRIPLFSSGQPGLAERVDELLAGFGEH